MSLFTFASDTATTLDVRLFTFASDTATTLDVRLFTNLADTIYTLDGPTITFFIRGSFELCNLVRVEYADKERVVLRFDKDITGPYLLRDSYIVLLGHNLVSVLHLTLHGTDAVVLRLNSEMQALQKCVVFVVPSKQYGYCYVPYDDVITFESIGVDGHSSILVDNKSVNYAFRHFFIGNLLHVPSSSGQQEMKVTRSDGFTKVFLLQ